VVILGICLIFATASTGWETLAGTGASAAERIRRDSVLLASADASNALTGPASRATTQPAAETPATEPTPQQAPGPPISLNAELDQLVHLITDNNTPEARELGARNLLARGSEAAAERLADILRGPADLAAKRAVCRAIASYADEVKSRPNPGGQHSAAALPARVLIDPLVGLLGEHPRELDDVIGEALRRFDSDLVIRRLKVLAEATTQAGTEASSSVTPSAADRKSPAKRIAAIRTLGSMGDHPQAVGVLIGLLRQASVDEQQQATQAVNPVPIRDAAIEALTQATGVQYRDAAAARAWWEAHRTMTPLQWLQDANARRIKEIAQLRAQREVLTQRLVSAYREAYLHTPEARRPEKLLAFLDDESTAVRRLGLDLINAMITDRKDVGQKIKARLLEMIADHDAQVRRAVAVMVGDLRLPGAVARLTESLALEEDSQVRAAQVAALGRLDDASAIGVLIGRLNDESPKVVREAALALGALARKGHAKPLIVEQVAAALLKRFRMIPVPQVTPRHKGGNEPASAAPRPASVPDNEDLRERFLEAMGHVGAERFREVFKGELTGQRSLRIRQAAIAGLASYADDRAADEVRKYVAAAEPEIRLAAVQALGRCGRGAKDLDALSQHLDSSQESNAAVRDRAWDSYLTIVQRMPPQAQQQAAAAFDRPGDLPAQRRRLSLLRSLQGEPARYDQLSPPQRLSLLEAIVDAQFELGQYDAAIKSLEESLLISPAPDATTSAAGERSRRLAIRLLKALLKAGRDKDAVARLMEFTGGIAHDGVAEARPAKTLRLDRPGLDEAAHVFANEAGTRLADADDAAKFSALLGLIDLASPVISQIAPPVAKQLADLRRQALARRESVVDHLLKTAQTEPGADPQLLAFGKELVLPKIVARLTAISPTSGPATAPEDRLVELAKKLVPSWPGYAPGGPPQQRAAALERLKKHLPDIEKPTETIPSSGPDG